MYSSSERSWSTRASPSSAPTVSAKANKPAVTDFAGVRMSAKRRRTNPAAKKITVAMIGISDSSAQRSPMRGTRKGTRTTPSMNPVPITMAK
jgi:hypothetical protein